MNEFFDIFGYNEEGAVHEQDLFATLKKHHDFSDKWLAHAAYLAEMDEFRNWIQGEQSDILLVDACVGGQVSGRTSPMSIFCSMLIQNLQTFEKERSRAEETTTHTVTLYFFCGQHTLRTGEFEGPYGLIRSLVGQLLISWPESQSPDIAFLNQLGDFSSRRVGTKVETLCQIFRRLVSQLSAGTTLYCIVDGISDFDTSLGEQFSHLKTVVQCFKEAVTPVEDTPGTAACVKIMMASANSSSTLISDIIPLGRHVVLSAGNLSPLLATPTSVRQQLLGSPSSTPSTPSPMLRRRSTGDGRLERVKSATESS